MLLRQNQDKSDRYLFVFGTVMGGVYEYVCSAVTELLFGTVFWDYSKFKFNLGGAHQPAVLLLLGHGGRGVDALRLPGGHEVHDPSAQPGAAVDDRAAGGVHGGEHGHQLAGAGPLRRPHQRGASANAVETYLDAHFDNARMERIYPNAKKVEKAG